jgi:hypothetical protein
MGSDGWLTACELANRKSAGLHGFKLSLPLVLRASCRARRVSAIDPPETVDRADVDAVINPVRLSAGIEVRTFPKDAQTRSTLLGRAEQVSPG